MVKRTLKNQKKGKKTKKSQVGGGLIISDIPEHKRKCEPNNGDILITIDNPKFTAFFNGLTERGSYQGKSDIKYLHDKGFAWGSNCGAKWIAISPKDHDLLIKEKKISTESTEDSAFSSFDKSDKEESEIQERKYKLETIENAFNLYQKTREILPTTLLSIVKDASLIYRITGNDLEKIYKKKLDNHQEFTLNIDTNIPESWNLRGWTVYPEISTDWYSWVSRFEANKKDMWIIADMDIKEMKGKLYASSKQALDDFMKSYKFSIFDFGDI